MITKPPYYILITLLLVLCCSQTQNSRLNLSFEEIENGLPSGWKINHYQGEYLVSLDSVNVKSGKYSVTIESKGDSSYVQALALELPHNYDGQRITLSGYIKTENIDNATLWVAIEPGIGFAALPKNEIVGTTDWKKYEVSLDLNTMRTQKISIGGMLIGKGKMWIDDLKVTIDGRDISKAKPYEFKPYPAKEDREFDNGSKIEFPELSEQKIDDLELLGRIWGVLKYHHPEVGKGKYDWDDELFQFLPEYMNVNDARQRDESLLRWIEKYGELPECTSCKETAADAYQKPDFSWVENGNMSAVLKEKIMEIYQNRHQGTHYYVKKVFDDGNPEFLNEQTYSTSFPDKNLRLLALYRYWNIIQYFFPYKYLTDKKWDEVLREYIPVFINAKTALDYQLAILQLTGETNDTHARHLLKTNEIELLRGTRYAPLRTNEIDSLRGTKYAPFRVRFIENKLTVTGYFKPKSKETTGLEIGDFITHVNGKKIEYIIDSIKSYYPASNEAARMYYIASDLVRSNNNLINIVYNSSGTIKQKELTMYERSDLNMGELNNELSYDSIMIGKDSMFIGYITLATIKKTEISQIKKSFVNAKGIIIDIRNYPAASVAFALGEFFTSKRKPFAKFTTGNLNNPGEFNFTRNVFLNNNGGNHYSLNYFKTYKSENYFQKKIVVIVNEETISQAEYTAMAFRAGDNTVIIGSQTQGADGNISFIPLPGGIKAGISGIGVYYPDGSGTQRIGIVPDIEVKPTIQGIREGRDELLEKAIELIKNEDTW